MTQIHFHVLLYKTHAPLRIYSQNGFYIHIDPQLQIKAQSSHKTFRNSVVDNATSFLKQNHLLLYAIENSQCFNESLSVAKRDTKKRKLCDAKKDQRLKR
ncbi:CLUMA_CG016058, isoform A [Clunio marinus]|uniref:CLUMA_CG016058, isoform A n=1 Tax=Clunio marinus TaxID=568069 RepID=A0A1J1ITH2_9DIPT|nr:CLUMA_CG016058, isoform A [Clunio marinus]